MMLSTPGAPSESRIYRPGEMVSEAGIYKVVHWRHRMPHNLTFLSGEPFPSCKRCGDEVRFELLHEAPTVQTDVDLLGMIVAISGALLASAQFLRL